MLCCSLSGKESKGYNTRTNLCTFKEAPVNGEGACSTTVFTNPLTSPKYCFMTSFSNVELFRCSSSLDNLIFRLLSVFS